MPLLLVALVIILMLAERKVISSISSAVKNDLVKLTLKVECTKLLFFSTGVKGILQSLFYNFEHTLLRCSIKGLNSYFLLTMRFSLYRLKGYDYF